MSLTILRGVSGSGKSTYLIEELRRAVREGRTVVTIICSDFPRPDTQRQHYEAGVFGSRRPDARFTLDHYVSNHDLASTLSSIAAGTLVAIDDAYMFDPASATQWVEALSRGVDLIIAAPSQAQMNILSPHKPAVRDFVLLCQSCNEGSATTVVIDARDGLTRSLCNSCMSAQSIEAVAALLDLLRAADPCPGQEVVREPVELPEFATWRLLRPDSDARAAAMSMVLTEVGLGVAGTGARPTFLDVGSSTGYFCNHFANAGYLCKGIDRDRSMIEAALLLDSYVRRPTRRGATFVNYEVADAISYLAATSSERFDVCAGMSLVSSILDGGCVEEAIGVITGLAARTRRVLFLEVGPSSSQGGSSGRVVDVDQDWVSRVLGMTPPFSEIRWLDRREHGLERDLVAVLRDC